MMDPPYGAGLAQPALDRAAAWLAPGGWLSVELHGETLTVPEGLAVETERRFGKATLLLFRRGA
jgi:16S rRNA (guanine966-N2)-methyltransferase